MRLPRSFATGLWLTATVVSTSMVWTATSIVAADVTDRPAPVVDHDEVVNELQSGSSTAPATPTTAPRPLTTPSSTPTQPRGPVPAPTIPSVPVTTPSQPRQPGVPVAPTPPLPTPTTVAAAPPTTRAASPPTTSAPRPSATYSTKGGVVRVACSGYFIELISSIPSHGWAVNGGARGPGNVEGHFLRSNEDLSVKAVCFGQPIRYYEENPPR